MAGRTTLSDGHVAELVGKRVRVVMVVGGKWGDSIFFSIVVGVLCVDCRDRSVLVTHEGRIH